MSLNAKKATGGNGGGNRFEQPTIEEGTYPGRLVQVIDLGIQPQRPFKGEEKPPVHMIHVTYELIDEFCVDEEGNEDEEKPRWLSEEFPLYNLKSERAKSTKRYYALDPNEEADGDWAALLTFPTNITVGTYTVKSGPNEGKVRNKVQDLSVMRPRDAQKCPDLVNEPKFFSLDEPDMEVFLTLPEWLQEKIKSNLEYNGSALQKLVGGSVSEEKEDPKPTPKKKAKAPEKAPEPDMDDGDGEVPW